LNWYSCGWRLFMKAPAMWLVMMIIMLVIAIVLVRCSLLRRWVAVSTSR
jgi:uncharacterized membrane protein